MMFQPGSFWKIASVAGETFSARTIFNYGSWKSYGKKLWRDVFAQRS